MQEIYWTKLAINAGLNRAEAKRRIIQRSIHGVDLDAGAVEIARLRFWLALVVDEDAPRPLPNLDYQIMQGNSLLESFEGERLDNLAEPTRYGVRQRFGSDEVELDLGAAADVIGGELTVTVHTPAQHALADLQSRYFACHQPEAKARLRAEIDAAVLRAIDARLTLRREELEASLRAQAGFAGRAHERGAEKKRTTIQAELDGLTGKSERLHECLSNPRKERPFFLWHLWFREVFARGGFDIVIANPPYVRQESIKELKPALKVEPYECFNGLADLLVYFYERAVKVLRPGGVITFITSNKFYRAGYGEALRAFLARELTLQRLIDFGDAPIFEAIAYASILEGIKAVPTENAGPLTYTWERGLPFDTIAPSVESRGQIVRQSELTTSGWRLERIAVLHLLAKLRQAGKPLREYINGRIYRGITTGLNEVFVITDDIRNRLIAEHASSAEVLKPFLRGRDVNRWKTTQQSLWLIFTRTGIDISRYPAILSHLEQFRSSLMPGVPNGRKPGSYKWYEIQDNIAYWREFEQPKILSTKVSLRPTFSLDTSDSYIGNTAYFLPARFNGLYVLALLNSSVFHIYAKKIFVEKQNGWYEVQPDGLESFPIPIIASNEQATLTALVDRILAAKRTGDESAVRGLEAEIDAHVYRLYGLTADEIQLVENANAPR